MITRTHIRLLGKMLLSLLLLSMVLAASLGAQSRVSKSDVRTLSVQVIDGADRPVGAAHVELVNGPLRFVASTDSIGRVRFANLVADSIVINIRRIGYFPTRIRTHRVDLGDRITILLDQHPDVLRAVEVRERMPSVTRLAEFEARLRSGAASAAVTRAQIERRNPVRLSQMLRGVSGLRLADSLGSMVAISTRGMKSVPTASGGFALVPCVMRLMLDGIVLPALTDIDAVVPQDVHGVEVFFGAASIPSAMAGSRTDNWCGLIAIWTRSVDP
jgi:hypothetical protein